MDAKLILCWCILVPTLLVISMSEMSEHRVVEVLVVIDKPTYDKWRAGAGVETHEDVVAEVRSFFFEVNVIYQSLRAFNQSVEIRLADIKFPNVTIPNEINEKNQVPVVPTMNLFRKWLKKNVHEPYDHAMHLTKFTFKDSYGNAYENKVCDRQWGISQLTMRGNYRTVSTMAHEIGHSLGASHDSKKNPECNGAFVMYSGAWTGTRNRWFFSPCSAKKFAKTLFREGKKKCLLPDKTTTQPIVSHRLGELVKAKNQCKRFYGNKVHPIYNYGDSKCNTLKCYNDHYIKKTNTAEGTGCGNGKQCFGGHCV